MTSAFREAPCRREAGASVNPANQRSSPLHQQGPAAGLSAVFLKLPWMGIAAAFGVPYGCGVLLLFTTWADIKLIVAAAKGGVDA